MQTSSPDLRRARRRRRRVRDEDRKRAPRACRRCKTRKNKCIETSRGVCERCLQGSHACVFDRDTSPREDEDEAEEIGATGPAPELTPSTSFKDSVTQDQTGTVTSPLPNVLGTLAQDDGLERPKGLLTDTAVSERLVWPGFLSRLRRGFSLDSRPAPEEQEVISMQASIARQPPQPAEMRRLQDAISGFPPRPIAEFLLSVCIEHGTDAFFYFDQATFAAELDQFYNDEFSRLRHDSSFVCLALATFALGSQWTTLAKPERSRGEYALPEDTDPGRIFYNHARTLVPDILDRQCIRSVQAAFVLGVYLAPASAITAAYVYMGLALRKAVSLGLHLGDTDDPHLTENDNEIQRRLWWAIFSLERTMAVKLNRPRSIDQSSLTVPLPSQGFSIDRNQKFDNIEHQIANAKLVLTLDRVSDVSIQHKDGALSLQQYLADLTAWKRALPPSLKLENVHPRSSGYRAVFHLYLNYYFAKIAALKVSVVTAVRARLHSALVSPEADEAEISQDIRDQCAICTRAAKKILELFKLLATTRNVTRFSFTDFQGCSIATIIILVAGILEREPTYGDNVEFGIDCLRRMVGGNATAKLGIRFVEAVRAIADEARDKLCRAEQQQQLQGERVALGTSSDSTNDQQVAEYNRWAAWLATAESVRSRPDNGLLGELSAVQESPGSGDIDPTLLPPQVTTAVPMSWDGNGPLHHDPTHTPAELLPTTITHRGTSNQHHPLDFEAEFSTAFYNDDQTYLMGLTGLDILSFAGPLE